jgi:hypothetical protein
VFDYDKAGLLSDIERNEGNNTAMIEKLKESVLRVRR